MSLKEFIVSKLFLKQLAIALAIFAGAIMILLLGLNIYTHHGQALQVPNFIGLSIDESVKLAQKSKMRITVIDSVYTSLVGRGCIAEQNPEPGFKVKKWRSIALINNAFRPEMVVMPNLIDLSLRQAIAQIESSGLTMGKKSYKPDLSIDVVLGQLHNGQDINPGDSITKGSVIDLLLGKGLSNQRTTIPDLIGLALDPAKEKILGTSLNLGTYIYDNTIVSAKDSTNAFVYKQSPDYREDATLQFGSSIYLWLTVDSTKLPVDSTIINMPDTVLPAAVLH
jgi:beta-lactam-binding protein with PASTA domain